MSENTDAGLDFPALCRKKVTIAFNGGRLTSDAGVLMLGQIEGTRRQAENSGLRRGRL